MPRRESTDDERGERFEVFIHQSGRGGTIEYRDAEAVLEFPWEFGGGDVIAMVLVGTSSHWQTHHPRAVGRRDLIIRRTTEAIIRQRAPGCLVDLDEGGWLNFRRGIASEDPTEVVGRGMKGIVFTILGLIAFAALAVCQSAFAIETTGTPWGPSARAGNAIVTLIKRLEPYTASLNRDHRKDLYSIGLLIHDASDPKARRFLPMAQGKTGSDLTRSKIEGVDGDRVWVSTPSVGAWDLRRERLSLAEELTREGAAPPDRPTTLEDLATGDRPLLMMLTSGAPISETRWLAVADDREREGAFAPGLSPSEEYPLERSDDPRRLYALDVEPSRISPTITAATPIGDDRWFNASFMRASRKGEILRLQGGGFLLLYESKPSRTGALIAARVDESGKLLWRTDTGIRTLVQVLPDPSTPALIGERPEIEGKAAEPILAVIDVRTGAIVTHSLWMKD